MPHDAQALAEAHGRRVLDSRQKRADTEHPDGSQDAHKDERRPPAEKLGEHAGNQRSARNAEAANEVARLRGEMEQVMRSTGWKGTLAEFFQHLRAAPRFYHRTPEELLLHYRALAKRIDPTLVKLFRTLPRAPYAVEPTPAALAPDVTTGFYYPGAADGSRQADQRSRDGPGDQVQRQHSQGERQRPARHRRQRQPEHGSDERRREFWVFHGERHIGGESGVRGRHGEQGRG